MPTVNIFYTDNSQEQKLEQLTGKLKALVAKELYKMYKPGLYWIDF